MEAAAKNAIKSRPRAGSEDDLSRGRGDETYENEQVCILIKYMQNIII